jgi:hypothetical protein
MGDGEHFLARIVGPAGPFGVRRSGTRGHVSVLMALALVVGGLVTVAATAVATAGSASAGTPPPPPSGWTTVFSDDFSGPAGSPPNPANWFYDEGTGFGTGEIETMTNSTANCSLDGDGDLRLTAIKSASGAWTSCRLESTQDDFYAPPGGELERLRSSSRTRQVAMPLVTGRRSGRSGLRAEPAGAGRPKASST